MRACVVSRVVEIESEESTLFAPLLFVKSVLRRSCGEGERGMFLFTDEWRMLRGRGGDICPENVSAECVE